MLPELSCIWNNLLMVSIDTSRPDPNCVLYCTLLSSNELQIVPEVPEYERDYMGKRRVSGRKMCKSRSIWMQQPTTESFKSVMEYELIKTYFPAVKLRQSYHYKITLCSDSYSKIIDPTLHYTGVFPQVSILVCLLWEFEETLPSCYYAITVKLECSHLGVKLWLWNPKPKLLQMLWISFSTRIWH